MKRSFTKIIAITLASSVLFQSCIGSFALTGKVLEWNKSLGNKFINELVFLLFCILPVYEISVFIDVVILNLVEFWTDSNPMAYNTQEITTEKGRFLVETTPAGHKITNMATNEVVSFKFNETEKSWSLETKDGVQPLFVCIDDTHVKTNDGKVVALSEAGMFAFRNVVENQRNLALN